MIGVLAANQEPGRFAKLIMIGPSPRYINDDGYVGGFEKADIDGLFEMMDRNFIGWANFMAPAIMGNGGRPELGQELTESFCSTDPVIARRFAEATFLADNRKDFARITAPTLVLQSREDIIAAPAVGQYVANTIPDSSLVMLASTGHCPHLSAPLEVTAAIREFLG